jgi:hypothetical protein
MTKGKRQRKRERAQHAARNGPRPPVSANAVIAEAEQHSVDAAHSPTGTDGAKENIDMALKAGISQWIRENANAVIAVFTCVIAAAAVIQVFIYSSQLDWLRVDERAWLAVKFTPFNGPAVNLKLPAPIIIGNTGKTVAKNIDGWILFRPVPIQTPLDLGEYKKVEKSSLPEGEPVPAWVHFGTGIIFPNDTIPIQQAAFASTPAGKDKPEAAIWDQGLQDKWVKGDIYLALHGKFTYEDAVGTRHWTTFCNVWVAAGTGKNISLDDSDRCNAYNTVDSNK